MRPFVPTIFLDRFLDLHLFADVESMRLAGAAGGLDLGLHAGKLVGLAAGDHDMRAQRGELVRRAAADAAAAAGDDHGLAFEQPRLKTDRYDMFPPP